MVKQAPTFTELLNRLVHQFPIRITYHDALTQKLAEIKAKAVRNNKKDGKAQFEPIF